MKSAFTEASYKPATADKSWAILGENYKSIQKAKGKTPDSPPTIYYIIMMFEKDFGIIVELKGLARRLIWEMLDNFIFPLSFFPGFKVRLTGFVQVEMFLE